MVGFVKQLVDELRWQEKQRYPIAFLTFIRSVVTIGKAPAKPSVTIKR